MALERGLKGWDQLLKLVKRHAREIQERHRTGLQLSESYTCHGSCLLSLYGEVRGASYQKESGINSFQFLRNFRPHNACEQAEMILYAALDPSIARRARKGEFVRCLDHFDLLQTAIN